MNDVIHPAFAGKLAPLNAETFEAWTIATSNDNGQPKVADPIDVSAAACLDEVLEIAAARCWHKDMFAVLHTHEGRQSKVLHLYAIKQESKATYRRNPQSGLPEATRRRYPVRIMPLEVNEFAPVERWTYQGDAVGLDAQLVEQKL